MSDLSAGPRIRLAGSPMVAALSTHPQVRTSARRETMTTPHYVLPSDGTEPSAAGAESEVARDARRPGWPGRRPFYVRKESAR